MLTDCTHYSIDGQCDRISARDGDEREALHSEFRWTNSFHIVRNVLCKQFAKLVKERGGDELYKKNAKNACV